MMSTDGFSAAYLKDVARGFRNYEMLGNGALAQVSDEDFYRTIDPDANSIANLVKHVGGNLESRFRDFLTSDGEKPDRDRDAEFEFPGRPSRVELLGTWETGWKTTLAAIDALTPADLERTVTIRSEAFLSSKRWTARSRTRRITWGRSRCSPNTSPGRAGRRSACQRDSPRSTPKARSSRGSFRRGERLSYPFASTCAAMIMRCASDVP